jgi:hypothetical protein
MKRLPAIVLTFFSFACLVGCSRRPSNPRAALVGKYRLHWATNSDCSGRAIAGSTLELREDGTSEQRDRFSDGSEFVTHGKWQYGGNDDVLFDNLRTTTTLEIDKHASVSAAGLIVQWSKPPNILLNPDDSCLYAKE